MPASLREIQNTLVTLWTNKSARDSFLAQAKKGKNKKRSKSAEEAVAAQRSPVAGQQAKAEALADAGAIQGTAAKRSSNAGQQAKAEALAEAGALQKGLQVYADLITIGRNELMLSVYPGCANLLALKWQSTVDDYFEKYPPDHFRLNFAAGKYSEYLTNYRQDCLKKFPYLSELADYEWLELQLMEDERTISQFPCEPLASPEHFEKLAPAVNPVLAIRSYSNPIPVIVDYLRQGQMPRNIKARTVSVAIYRDPETHFCRYAEITEAVRLIIETAQAKPTSYAELARQAVAQINAASPELALVEFMDTIEKLQSLNVFVGNSPTT